MDTWIWVAKRSKPGKRSPTTKSQREGPLVCPLWSSYEHQSQRLKFESWLLVQIEIFPPHIAISYTPTHLMGYFLSYKIREIICIKSLSSLNVEIQCALVLINLALKFPFESFFFLHAAYSGTCYLLELTLGQPGGIEGKATTCNTVAT